MQGKRIKQMLSISRNKRLEQHLNREAVKVWLESRLFFPEQGKRIRQMLSISRNKRLGQHLNRKAVKLC